MQSELACEGEVRMGSLPWDISERLAQFRGNWLEFTPADNTLKVQKTPTAGCPAITGVPCELITIIDSIPPDRRQSMPGGVFYVKDRGGRVMRLVVEEGEVRVQWPCEDYSRPVSVPPESVLGGAETTEIRVQGWARFAGSAAKVDEIQMLLDRFEGIYPERDLPSECEQNLVHVRFKEANVMPHELVAKLRELADPLESLEAELDVRSYVPRSQDRDFRLFIHNGRIQAVRPSLWKQE